MLVLKLSSALATVLRLGRPKSIKFCILCLGGGLVVGVCILWSFHVKRQAMYSMYSWCTAALCLRKIEPNAYLCFAIHGSGAVLVTPLLLGSPWLTPCR